ncbi:MAG TPA: zeta toxin family protein [Chlamydiales bacterium]|nr:zeta toxin family protein [Chlamydiales bacterium]
MKKILFFYILSTSLFAEVFFSPPMIEKHLQGYSNEEKALIEKDLIAVRSVCMGKAHSTDAPVYLATAGAPGARKSTTLERFLSTHPEYNDGAYLDPDPRTLRYMIHTYYQSLNPFAISTTPEDQNPWKNAYDKWKGGSNYIALTLLEEAFAQRMTVIYGTTSTGDHIPTFFSKLKTQGYKIVLLLCSCDDAFRKESITYRNEVIRFYQSSPEDALLKGKLFPQKMSTYFKYADTLYFYWSDDRAHPERLAAILDKGRLEIKDGDAFHLFIQKYERDRTALSLEGKELPSFNECLLHSLHDPTLQLPISF